MLIIQRRQNQEVIATTADGRRLQIVVVQTGLSYIRLGFSGDAFKVLRAEARTPPQIVPQIKTDLYASFTCDRCGQDHEDVETYPLQSVGAPENAFCLCPVTKQPVLLETE